MVKFMICLNTFYVNVQQEKNRASIKLENSLNTFYVNVKHNLH